MLNILKKSFQLTFYYSFYLYCYQTGNHLHQHLYRCHIPGFQVQQYQPFHIPVGYIFISIYFIRLSFQVPDPLENSKFCTPAYLSYQQQAFRSICKTVV